MIWHPEPGETLLARKPVEFATGAAMPVRGMRWFRDTERRDIQGDLSGWPEGKEFTARSRGAATGLTLIKGGAIALGVLVVGVLTSQGSSPGSNSYGRRDEKSSRDRQNEVEDFPVMWAAPGTISRTLPWQLDPGRRPKKFTTHLIVTDRRLVIVGLSIRKGGEVVDDEELWQAPRDAVAAVEEKNFKTALDLKVVFTDGSWCRFASQAQEHLVTFLAPSFERVPIDTLSAEQQQEVGEFARNSPGEMRYVMVTRHPVMNFEVHMVEPGMADSFFGINYSTNLKSR